MASTQQLRGWFDIEGERYGPATCDVIEQANVSLQGMMSLSIQGTFAVDPTGAPLPHHSTRAVLVLEDGRQGDVLFGNTVNGISGEFKVQNDWRREGAP